MWVTVLGGNVEAKLAGVFDDLITQFHVDTCSLLIGLFKEDGVQSWIKLLSDVLQQNWLAELDGVFQSPQEVGIGQFDDVDLSSYLHLLDPLIGLALGINAEWPPS